MPSAVIETLVVYQDTMQLPAGSVLTVTFEEVSRMDAPSMVLAKRTMAVHAMPPYSVPLEYDPTFIEGQNRYAVRARIDNGDALLFISTTHTNPFADDQNGPVEIVVEKVKQ